MDRSEKALTIKAVIRQSSYQGNSTECLGYDSEAQGCYFQNVEGSFLTARGICQNVAGTFRNFYFAWKRC